MYAEIEIPDDIEFPIELPVIDPPLPPEEPIFDDLPCDALALAAGYVEGGIDVPDFLGCDV